MSRIERIRKRFSEPKQCPHCGSTHFLVARDMKGTRMCRCGARWLPVDKDIEYLLGLVEDLLKPVKGIVAAEDKSVEHLWPVLKDAKESLVKHNLDQEEG